MFNNSFGYLSKLNTMNTQMKSTAVEHTSFKVNEDDKSSDTSNDKSSSFCSSIFKNKKANKLHRNTTRKNIYNVHYTIA